MPSTLYTSLKQFGQVKSNESLAKYTSFKIGGPAKFLLVVHITEKLIDALKFLDAEGIRYVILGGGSNMLVRDEGFDGVVIRLQTLDFKLQEDVVEAEAGCATVKVAQESIKAGLTGFEWGVGVPGTIGGAVRGNAGAMDGEMKDVVQTVTIYKDGEMVTLSKADCQFGYRDSIFKHKGGVVIKVIERLEISASLARPSGLGKALEYLQYRNKTQPQGLASTGCIFKNFEFSNSDLGFLVSNFQKLNIEIPLEFVAAGKIPAAWLVEKADLKGVKVGKAIVSDRHGNFIVNLGGATSSDVITLIEKVKQVVYNKFGIELKEEIEVI